MKLFVYGELCRADVLRRLIGRVPSASPALLTDYVRRRNDTTGHFEVHPTPGGRVAGLLLDELQSHELARLDRFESTDTGLYRRTAATVRTFVGGEAELQVDVYVGHTGSAGQGRDASGV